jgi:hypothetical protein
VVRSGSFFPPSSPFQGDRRLLLPIVLGLLALTPREAIAVVHAGDTTPDFKKTDLDGASQTLSQYQGKVVVMFLLGYS